MRRREFIVGLGGAVAWPLTVRAQQPGMPVIGFLNNLSLDTRRDILASFHGGLSEIGFVEGRNVAFAYRWAEGRNDRLPALAADLVRHQVAVIAAPGGTALAVAAKAATQTIPIVFLMGSDPVEVGLVASLNRPGGNATGVSLLNVDLAAKRLELLHTLVPTAKSIAFLVNSTNPLATQAETREVAAGARSLGLGVVTLDAHSQNEIETVFGTFADNGAGALLVQADALFTSMREQIIALAARHAIVTMYQYRQFPEAGGLISYGTDLQDAFRLAGVFTGRILKGEKPADLPVQQVTKIELAINLKTAKALGLIIPETLLATADEVIQ
jgi:putative tryptophan/tyrosine transport system substrate-binding protein